MSKFSRVIDALQAEVDMADNLGGDGYPLAFADSCRAAIRVLEAAGNVDKEKAMERVAGVPYDEDHGVYGLIAALPDKEDE